VDDVGFRLSGNIDDRRNSSQPGEWGRALWAAFREQGPSWQDLQAMAKNPMTPWRDILAMQALPEMTPLSAQAGAGDMVSARDRWLAQRRADEAAEVARLQADPNVHSFDTPLDPSGPPVRLDRRKLPFGLGG
jgi:hypothetical protein